MRPSRPAHRADPRGVGTVEPDSDAGLLRQCLDGGCEALLGESHRVDAVCQLAELGEQQSQLLLGARELRIVAVLCDRETDRQRQRHKSLLGSVVKVALQPPAFGVARLDDSSARRAELLQLRTQLPRAGVRSRGPGARRTRPRRLAPYRRRARVCARSRPGYVRRDTSGVSSWSGLGARRRPAMSTKRPFGRRWSSSSDGSPSLCASAGPSAPGAGERCELDDKGSQRGTCAPGAHPLPCRAHRQQTERSRLRAPERELEGVVGHEAAVDAAHERPGNGDQIRASRHEYRQRSVGARRRRRAPPAAPRGRRPAQPRAVRVPARCVERSPPARRRR